MLRLIPPALHRLLLPLAHRGRKLWWQVTRPTLLGCRVLVRRGDGAVLLIRHTYGYRGWMLPGGGVRRSEDALAAAARELREEAGCTLGDARLIAVTEEPLWGARNRVSFVAGTTACEPRPDRREVAEAAFFLPGALPAELPARLAEQLSRWL